MVRSNIIPIVIAGPTASGKSKLALKLAKKYNGEIICADSRQFYKHMSIGTASPSSDELQRVNHHGYQAVDLRHTRVNANYFVTFANECITDIKSRGKRPILVGGTGFYLRALRYGLIDFPPEQNNNSDTFDEKPTEELYKELKIIDLKSAIAISKNDRYRIVRCLQIYYSTKKKPSSLRNTFFKEPKLKARWIYLKPQKEKLIDRIEHRVEKMLSGGLIEEALHLRKILEKNHWALEVMGYKEALMVADGEIDLKGAKNLITIRHRQYAKRQYTWFNKEKFYRVIT